MWVKFPLDVRGVKKKVIKLMSVALMLVFVALLEWDVVYMQIWVDCRLA
jgi:hypothetical protein